MGKLGCITPFGILLADLLQSACQNGTGSVHIEVWHTQAQICRENHVPVDELAAFKEKLEARLLELSTRTGASINRYSLRAAYGFPNR